MNRLLALTALAGIATGLWGTGAAGAALSVVRVGNFYFEDGSVGDGRLEIRQGDQLRFVVEDNGPGTPHSVEIDALGIHSGGLASGDTYTTPAIQKVGSYPLYCKLHERRGHVTTLVVLAAPGSSTTSAPTTTKSPTTVTTTATSSTVAPGTSVARSGGQPPSSTTTVLQGASGGKAGVEPVGAEPVVDAPGSPTDPVVPTTLAPDGRSRASVEELSRAEPLGAGVESVLGRRMGASEPWTRAVRMALAGLVPMGLAVAVSALGFMRTGDAVSGRGSEPPRPLRGQPTGQERQPRRPLEASDRGRPRIRRERS